ncbi:30S ribosomal protein S21 [Candidatus Microgenomates bacterium]|nr:30S ribosomal protein S21 [Candidatus Microgenomates bacterium]
MTQVVRKDDNEALENLIRRFNRKVLQSGVLGIARRKQYYERPPSKRALRQAAIRKRQRREAKLRKIYMGR